MSRARVGGVWAAPPTAPGPPPPAPAQSLGWAFPPVGTLGMAFFFLSIKQFFKLFYFILLFKRFTYLLSERGEGREKERERNH